MTVKHSKGSYEIHFVERQEVAALLPPDAPVITDTNVHRLMQDLIAGRETFAIPAGEENKNLEEFGRALEWLAEIRLRRRGSLIALGGGVVGDLAGFAAAAYMRGIKYVQVPTTLLAQVDSSVGGKVGVDLRHGKNLAGAFHPPTSVVICTDVLQTLDPSQFNNGMAEVWKYAFIRDPKLASELSNFRLTAEHPSVESVVRRCVEHKRDVVELDEHEKTGLRATLNFGHTVGHAIEQVTNYVGFLHGEAISVGMVAESVLGERLGVTKRGTSDVVRDCLKLQGLPVEWKVGMRAPQLLEAMRRDKKAGPGRLAFSLLTEIGECKLVEDVPAGDVESVLESL